MFTEIMKDFAEEYEIESWRDGVYKFTTCFGLAAFMLVAIAFVIIMFD